MLTRPIRAAAVAAASHSLALPLTAHAQDNSGAWSQNWTDEGIAKAADMLSGTWVAKGVGETGGGDGANVVMTISPVPLSGLSDTLYVEAARADNRAEPYRQAIFQLYNYKGKVRLRTYEFVLQPEVKGVMAGLGAAPDLFPDIKRDELIATLDVELDMGSGKLTGKTPYPYPTGTLGAIEMTSAIEVTANSFRTEDRGFDAAGNVVWGADKGDAVVFQRSADEALKAEQRESGVVVIDFVNPGESVVGDGDRVHTHYTGWVATGKKFDSSHDRGRAFIFEYPAAPGRMIEGWNAAIEGLSVGTHRKVYLPWQVAYGERGNPGAGIPSEANLIFQIECLHLDKPEPIDEDGAEGDD